MLCCTVSNFHKDLAEIFSINMQEWFQYVVGQRKQSHCDPHFADLKGTEEQVVIINSSFGEITVTLQPHASVLHPALCVSWGGDSTPWSRASVEKQGVLVWSSQGASVREERTVHYPLAWQWASDGRNVARNLWPTSVLPGQLDPQGGRDLEGSSGSSPLIHHCFLSPPCWERREELCFLVLKSRLKCRWGVGPGRDQAGGGIWRHTHRPQIVLKTWELHFV